LFIDVISDFDNFIKYAKLNLITVYYMLTIYEACHNQGTVDNNNDNKPFHDAAADLSTSRFADTLLI